MSIFPSESLNAYNEFKTEFEKIGVNTIRPFMVNSEWLFNYKNKDYPLAPSPIVSGTISPIIIGADSFIRMGCEAKNIKNPEQLVVLDGCIILNAIVVKMHMIIKIL